MVSSDFRNTGRVTIGGKRKTLYEHRHNAWYRFNKCNVQAKTRNEAIDKFRECAERAKAKQ